MLDPEIMDALAQYTKQITVPILYDDPSKLDQVGTGTMFDVCNRVFLVTAAHLFDGIDLTGFSIPSDPIRDPDPRTIGSFVIHRATNRSVDIAVLELLDPDTIARLRSGWHILTLESASIASTTGVFALCGYPSERARQKGNLIGGSLVTVYSERLPYIPQNAMKPVDPRLDLFFNYEDTATGTDGVELITPHLGGTSGASIWEYRDIGTTFWTPQTVFKIVGVQSAFRKGEYFRANSWEYVWEILHAIDGEISAALDEMTSCRI